MAIIIYEFYPTTSSMRPFAAVSDEGTVRSNNETMKNTLEGMSAADIVSRFDNGLSMTVQQYNDSVAKRIWNRWGRNNDD